MKRLGKIFTCLLIVFSFFVIAVAMTEKDIAYAEDEEVAAPTTEITSRHLANGYIDNYLYTVLCEIIKQDTGTSTDVIPTNYFQSRTTLDLSVDYLKTTYGITESARKIASLEGLQYLTLTNLQTLIVDGHSITEIASEQFTSVINSLTTLSVQNNKLASVDISSLTKLNVLKLSGNYISEIDISTMVVKGTDLPTCELVDNNITSADSIVLSNYTKMNLKLSNNRLYTTSSTNFPYKNAQGEIVKVGNVNQYHNVSLLYQGLKSDGKLVNGNYLVAIPDAEYPDFNIQVWSVGETPTKIAESKTIVDDVRANKVNLSTGYYTLKFCNGNTPITFAENEVSIYKNIFKDTAIEVYPSAPTFKVLLNGKEVDATKSIDKKFDVVATSPDSDVKTYVRYNGGEWVENNTVVIGKRGNYIVDAKVVYGTGVDALTSEIVSINVRCSISTNIVWGAIIVIAVIVLIVAGWFLIRWFRAGAVVAPIEPKDKRKR